MYKNGQHIAPRNNQTYKIEKVRIFLSRDEKQKGSIVTADHSRKTNWENKCKRRKTFTVAQMISRLCRPYRIAACMVDIQCLLMLAKFSLPFLIGVLFT